MSKRLAITLVVVGVVGLCAIAIVNMLTGRALRPFRSDLPIATKQFAAIATLAPGYRYRLALGGDGSVPHAPCLLGAGGDPLPAECEHYPSALEVAWSLRDDRGHVVASGISPGNQTPFEYGQHVEADFGYFSVFRSTDVRLTIQYRLDPAPLAPLRPYVVIDAPDALVWFGAAETLGSVLFATLACVGAGVLLVTRWRRD